MREDQGDVAEQIRTLATSSAEELNAFWVRCFGRPPQFRARKDLLVLILAYHVQEKAYGGLSHSARKRLAALAQLPPKDGPKKSSAKLSVKPGTRLMRQWRGDTHVVSVLENGAEYRGKRYGSLSEIARAITGTRWSGPAFFGLRQPPTGSEDKPA
jgi:hypothetical protein